MRYLGNRSSGKQGIALALEAAAQGAEVTLITGIIDAELPPELPGNLTRQSVETAHQLQQAVLGAAEHADMLIMAAAVADFRPAEYAQAKIKKSEDGENPVITLERNPDILADLVRRRNSSGRGPGVIVGFAAETGDEGTDPLDLAQQKLLRKGCELLVFNRVGEDLVFGQDQTEVHILASFGAQGVLGEAEPVHVTGSKQEAASAVVARAAQLLEATQRL